MISAHGALVLPVRSRRFQAGGMSPAWLFARSGCVLPTSVGARLSWRERVVKRNSSLDVPACTQHVTEV